MESPTISNKKKGCQLEFRTGGPDLIPFNLLGDPAALQALDLFDFSPLQQLAALGKAIFLENDERGSNRSSWLFDTFLGFLSRPIILRR